MRTKDDDTAGCLWAMIAVPAFLALLAFVVWAENRARVEAVKQAIQEIEQERQR